MPDAARKTRMLVTFIPTHIGGAMTSLVNFLNALDLDRYDVDVIFLEEREAGRHGIKDGINILPQAKVHESLSAGNLARKLLSPRYMLAKLREQYHFRITKNRKRGVQIMSRQGCRYSRRLETHYDVAISYEFGWCMYYTAHYVKADRKILWQHPDYAAMGFDFREDKSTFARFDHMVFVSEETRAKFTAAHPEYAARSLFLPNLLAADYVRARGEEPLEPLFPQKEGVLTMVSVSRLNYVHKGMDRGITVLCRLREEGLLERIRWIVVGDGNDSVDFTARIAAEGLEPYVRWVGRQKNPIPYLRQSDLLFLPSRTEGKPMAVTEAQIMGVVPLVTRYPSADEQLGHGKWGIVTDNNEDALYAALRDLLHEPEKLEPLREAIAAHDFGNTHEIAAFDRLIDSYAKEERP